MTQLLCPTAIFLWDMVSLEAPQGFSSGREPYGHRHRADSWMLAPCHNISLFNTKTKGGGTEESLWNPNPALRRDTGRK